METVWGRRLDREHPLPEYPRPQFVRDSYLNLNGVWDYTVARSAEMPDAFDGTIVVPFSPEAPLSGAARAPEPEEYGWYRRAFTLPADFNRGRVLLHFGAVDQEAAVWLNGRSVCAHTGGYLPFTADITAALAEENVLVVRVSDGTNRNCHTRGKQRLRRGGIWYTPQSGIWQTVWCESVPEQYIRALRLTPYPEDGELEIYVEGDGPCTAQIGEKTYAFDAGAPARLALDEVHLWSPEDPYLYPLTLTMGEDRAESYFAMRSFSAAPDGHGVPRLTLNGRPYFQNGLLDQGYWPDGLYTAPADEAMIFDIQTAKAMGFNMLRKHVKVEPLRWYYHCDRLGMLVWQDMPNGGGRYYPLIITAPVFTGIHLKDSAHLLFGRGNAAGRAEFLTELSAMVRHLRNCPCISMWVPFNEGWGQFDAARAAKAVQKLDPSRPVDHASGWHDQGAGDVKSLHVYFERYGYVPDKRGRAVVLSEFGGYAQLVSGHAFSSKPFGYKRFDSPNSLEYGLRKLYAEEILPAAEKGLSAAVYTQLSDVENEQNGLLTYDRAVAKVPPAVMRSIVGAPPAEKTP